MAMDNEARKLAFLLACGRKASVQMEDMFREVRDLEKLGEGIFGEVFIGKIPQRERGDGNISTGGGDNRGDGAHVDRLVVFKVVPINGDERVNGEIQKTYEEVAPEVIISKRLTELKSPGFVKLYGSFLTMGEYPSPLLEAWKEWDAENESDNDEPKFGPEQEYMVLLFEPVGVDCAEFRFSSSKQAFFTVLQVVHALAVGEIGLEFEHRDLHWNNILMQNTNEAEVREFRVGGVTKKVPTFGATPTLIDFTFSRIKGPIFYDMDKDQEMFLSTGEYQFDVYRMMRDTNCNDWAPFIPRSNIFWAHYFVDKLERRGKWDETTSSTHVHFLNQLRKLKRALLAFSSCADFVASDICSRFLSSGTKSSSTAGTSIMKLSTLTKRITNLGVGKESSITRKLKMGVRSGN